jgi:naphthoate synthase
MELTKLEDVRYEVERGLAWITIDRPERFNSFRARTVDELIRCFKAAWVDTAVGVIALTGAGDQAFCAGTRTAPGDGMTTARARRHLRSRRCNA